MQLMVKKLHKDAMIPKFATEGAACFDLHAICDTTFGGTLPVDFFDAVTFRTGLAFEVPQGHVMLVFSRSGHGFKNDVRLANCVGVIDSDYRGEIMVRLTVDGDEPFCVNKGDRIAQAMILPIPSIEMIESDELGHTERGAQGLGSTGK